VQAEPTPWTALAEPERPSPSQYDRFSFIDAVPGFAPQGAAPAPVAAVAAPAPTHRVVEPRAAEPPVPPSQVFEPQVFEPQVFEPQVFEPPPPSVALPPSGPEEDFRTVNRAELRAEQAGADSRVRAVLCPAGHPNPPFATACRVCSDPVAEQQPVEIARPPLGRLLVAGAPPVTLDRDVVLGRNPRIPDGYRSQPHLIRLTDPRQEVSGLHAVLSLRQWHVSVTDLGSTNGTEIITPDGRRQRLVPDSAVIIEPGTTIVLAEVLDLKFEAAG
jgi:hypothetical protein